MRGKVLKQEKLGSVVFQVILREGKFYARVKMPAVPAVVRPAKDLNHAIALVTTAYAKLKGVRDEVDRKLKAAATEAQLAAEAAEVDEADDLGCPDCAQMPDGVFCEDCSYDSLVGE